MASRKTFSAGDIGAELLPIITKGTYRDPLDTLREYIQNAVDAIASNIEVKITSDVVAVRDDGLGMDRTTAEKAIRLGISEKNPKRQVGFRGIGIYSAYDVCDRLEVYTRPPDGLPSKLVFDFQGIREKLRKEEHRRLKGTLPQLDLVNLLQDSVWVEDDSDHPLDNQGTLVLMVGIRGQFYKRFSDKAEVKRYLQAVVPLPFAPDFKFKKKIEGLFGKKKYRVVNLSLTLDGRTQRLYRPYYNGMFTHEKGKGPNTYVLAQFRGRSLGFAWVCLNDARRILPAKELCGLLIKKFGFSVGGREQLAQFFGRTVFYKRITGEVIVTHPDLLPNAARTEFEPGKVRDALYMAFGALASTVTSWAEGVQSQLKAIEELERVSTEAFSEVSRISSIERDVPELLRIHNRFMAHAKSLAVHEKTLKQERPALLKRTRSAVDRVQKQITEILSERGRGRTNRSRRIEQAMRIQEKAPGRNELDHLGDKPETLFEAITAANIETMSEVRSLLKFLDNELRAMLSQAEYADLVESIVERTEETL